MPNTKKKDTVTSLVKDVTSSEVIVITNYSGLTHKDLETVRGKVKDAKGDYKIVKNSLLKIALKEAGKPQDTNENLIGPTAVLLTSESDLSALKIIYDTTKDHENFKIKGGIWKTDAIDEAKVVRLATLPSREQLIAQLLGQLKTPSTKLVLTLKNPLTKLAIVLQAVKDKQLQAETKS